MKKLLLATAALILVLSIGTVGVLAAESHRSGNYIDENADGICDNRSACPRENYIDENQDGICDNRDGHSNSCRGNHHGKGHGRCH